MTLPNTMRALRIDCVTPGAEARLREIPTPTVKPGWALVKVEAFGLNNSERLVRLEEIGQPWIAPAIVPGIECAGTVANPGETDLAPGHQPAVRLRRPVGRARATRQGIGREDRNRSQLTERTS